MFQTVALEVLLILVLVIANGVFAMSEIALVTARKTRLQQMARRSQRAATALRLLANPDRLLSTVQVGITLIGVFAGAFGGATIAEQIDVRLETIPGLAPYSEAIGVGTVVLGITYLSLVVGELVPKKVALNAPERIAAAVAPVMMLLSRTAAPAVWLLTISTRALLRLLRVKESDEPPVTEEELKSLLRLGTKAGTIAPEERAIVERVFRLGERPITAVMTPRVDLEWLDLRKPLEELRMQVTASNHGWFPVAAERVDEIKGVVRGKDLWAPNVTSSARITEVMREPLFIPETATALAVLQRFREARVHVAVVSDEFGGIEGMVTPTDVLEGLVGELPEAGDAEEPMIVRRADGSWSIDATTDLDEVKLVLGVEFLHGQKSSFQTIGGYVAEQLGRQPTVGDTFKAGTLRFEILDTDGRRIDRVLVSVEVDDAPSA
ncbi:MAG TPA: hemolysin family protein [Thermoanaerobaculia bacterium]|nr:hemolysin family protein [Thermoanaerobaculia bacterium]